LATTNSNNASSPSHSLGAYLYQRQLDGNKYTSGRLLVDAGSSQFPGAAVLAVGGARRGGAGYINYLGREPAPTDLVLRAYPDVVPLSDETEIDADLFDAILIGPGSPRITALPRKSRLVIDGGALALAMQPHPAKQIRILTPHEGEIRKLGFDPTDRKSCALQAAAQLRAVLLLKGRNSIVATPQEIIFIDEISGPELSTAGTGDVLAGLIAAMIASHRPNTLTHAAEITAHAVEIFSAAAQVAVGSRAPLVATDLLDAIPMLLARGETSL